MKILIRCDATAETGLGHLSRCLAVAEALREQAGECEFVGHFSPGFLQLPIAAGFPVAAPCAGTGSVNDAIELAVRVSDVKAAGVLADDYRFDSAWLRCLAGNGVAPTLFDDFARLQNYVSCSGTVNFTLDGTRLPYPGLTEARVLRGPSYFPARHALRTQRKKHPRVVAAEPKRVLVALGGADQGGLTWHVLELLRRLAPTAEVRAVVSPTLLESAEARRFSGSVHGIAPSLAEHYAWADACIAGGGLTKYECAYLGLPVAILSMTDDQQAETRVFAAEGLGYDLGGFRNLAGVEAALGTFLQTKELRQRLSAASGTRFPADSTAELARHILSWWN